ncbi:MAG: hypothetical protein AAGF47_01610 [Planctomycetota bacterium]
MRQVRANLVTEVIGLTPEGMPILGRTFDLSQYGSGENAARTPTAVYDTIGLGPDTDGDGFAEFVCGIDCGGFTGDGFRFLSGPVTQVVADDFSVPAAAAGAPLEELAISQFNLICNDFPPPTPGTEPFEASGRLINFFESSVRNPVGDGTDGFDNDGDGVLDAPFDTSTFLGGLVFWAGDAEVPEDWFFTTFFSDGFVDAGINIPMPSIDDDGDGNPDGFYEILYFQDAEDTDGDGDLDVFTPATDSFGGLWGTPADDIAGCQAAVGFNAPGTATNGVWGEGLNLCGDVFVDTGWSDGGVGADGISPPEIDGFYDNTTDLAAFAPPDAGCPLDLHWSVFFVADFEGGGELRDCGDVNGDGVTDGSDFFAWTAAFGSGDLIPCDVNNDGNCDGSDFFAWTSFFGNPAGDPGDCAPLP